jgi:hypothetical protein
MSSGCKWSSSERCGRQSQNSNGVRLKDAEGNLKTLRHKFAVYCNEVCAGADTIEELYELYEALICCCKRAGIQVKASKTKFGVEWISTGKTQH